MTGLRVSEVHLSRSSPRDYQSGLVGFVRCVVGDLRVDGLGLRRTRAGRYSISLPRRRGHAVVCPLTPEATRALEAQILAALGLENAP
jgi:hypothetical protein